MSYRTIITHTHDIEKSRVINRRLQVSNAFSMKLMVTLLTRRLRIECIVSAKARLMHLRMRSSEIGNIKVAW